MDVSGRILRHSPGSGTVWGQSVSLCWDTGSNLSGPFRPDNGRRSAVQSCFGMGQGTRHYSGLGLGLTCPYFLTELDWRWPAEMFSV